VRLASQPYRSGGSIGQDTPELVARFDAEFDENLFRWAQLCDAGRVDDAAWLYL
jgi:hypothetical protein